MRDLFRRRQRKAFVWSFAARCLAARDAGCEFRPEIRGGRMSDVFVPKKGGSLCVFAEYVAGCVGSLHNTIIFIKNRCNGGQLLLWKVVGKLRGL